jgi:hypothetical protein
LKCDDLAEELDFQSIKAFVSKINCRISFVKAVNSSSRALFNSSMKKMTSHQQQRSPYNASETDHFSDQSCFCEMQLLPLHLSLAWLGINRSSFAKS